MQLMSEPHNRRQHFIEAPAFYSNDSNPAQVYYPPEITTLNTGASPIVQAHPGYTSQLSGAASTLQQQQQDVGIIQVSGNHSVCGTSGLPTSEITNQTQAIATETTEALASSETDLTTNNNIQTFDDESSRASTVSYQGEQSAYLAVKQEPILSEQLLGAGGDSRGASSGSGGVAGSNIANNIGIIGAARQQSNLRMNIQPTGFTKNHLLNNSPDELSLKKRREDLSRRPSYRKIFNDLTGLSGPLETPQGTNAHMIANVGQLAPPTAPSHRQSPHQSVTGSNQTQATTSSPSPQALDLLSSVGMSAAATSGLQDPSLGASHSPISVVDLQTTSAANQLAQQQLQHQHQQQQQQSHQHHHLPPPPIPQSTNHHQQQQQQQHVQHHHQQQQQQQQQHHHQHQQHHPQQHQQQHQQHPQLHHHQQQQLQPPPAQHHRPQASQSHQAHHMLNTTTSPPITGKPGEEVNKKRELRLQKNREAAKECRRKKKEYIKCLENRVAVLENQNKALIDELKTLKDLYCKSTNE